MATREQRTQPTLFLGEPEQPAISAHRDIPSGGVCARCGRPTRAGVTCGWHKAGAPRGKRERQALVGANPAGKQEVGGS